ncbi:uncharacterized protein H6S33_012655 [Morchella sextelata]|uniref:uncharacterized protein n=1 Tax=Morchella sextelata TaxID=1174677 RepID=UPI001D0583AA|nr:uncharacterized protein H6S33_012655 [Morchella sextelata]KAH0610109.1 hypothetical protein H6S33_012655 [Morchella sextelata]
MHTVFALKVTFFPRETKGPTTTTAAIKAQLPLATVSKKTFKDTSTSTEPEEEAQIREPELELPAMPKRAYIKPAGYRSDGVTVGVIPGIGG